MATEMNCEMIVANAGPATPNLNTKMNSKSKIIFNAEETLIANRGVLLSPIPLKMDESKLYATVMSKPLNITQP